MTQDRVQPFQFAKSPDRILNEPPRSPATLTSLRLPCHTTEREVAKKLWNTLESYRFHSHGCHTGSLLRGFAMFSSSRENPKTSLTFTLVSRLNSGPEKTPEPSLHIKKIIYLHAFCPPHPSRVIIAHELSLSPCSPKFLPNS